MPDPHLKENSVIFRDHGEAAQSALLEELARDVYRLEPSAAVDIERAKERSFEAP